MPRKCIVKNCQFDKVITSFSLPKDENLRKKWLKAIPQLKSNVTTNWDAVCIKHFDNSCIVKHRNGIKLKRLQLKKDSVPSIFQTSIKRKINCVKKKCCAVNEINNSNLLYLQSDKIVINQINNTFKTKINTEVWTFQNFKNCNMFLKFAQKDNGSIFVKTSLTLNTDFTYKIFHEGNEMKKYNNTKIYFWTQLNDILNRCNHYSSNQNITDVLSDTYSTLKKASEDIVDEEYLYKKNLSK